MTSAGSVIQSRYWVRLPSLVIHLVGPIAILPIRAGGLGGRFFSLRRSGVAGKGRGGNDSPPVWCCGLAGGGGPQSTGPLSPSSPKTNPGSVKFPPIPAATLPVAAVNPIRSMNRRRENLPPGSFSGSCMNGIPLKSSPQILDRHFGTYSHAQVHCAEKWGGSQ